MQASRIHSIFIKLYYVFISVKVSLIVIYYSYRRRKLLRKRADECFVWWAQHCVEAIRLHYSIEDPYQLQLDSNKKYIVMCNHSSFYDIPLSALAIKGSLRMMAKEELFRVPIWGRGMKASEFIPVCRQANGRRKVAQQLSYAKEKLKSGIILWIAPEGTRSRDGQLQAFKRGGFKIARQMMADIIPLRIEGAHRLYDPKSKCFLLQQQVRLHLGKVIRVSDYSTELELMAAVQTQLQ